MANNESIFVIVEGKKNDRWYFDRLLRVEDDLAELGILTYTVASLTRNVTSPTGQQGKSGVLDLFRTLRASQQLRAQNSTGTKTMVFCVDADHDRFTGRMMRSDHLVYTRLPDVEAQILEDAELRDIVSIVASLPPDDAKAVVDSLGDWASNLVAGRLEWMILCCTAETIGASNSPCAGTPHPQWKSDPMSPVPPAKVLELRQQLNTEFHSDLALLARHVNRARTKFDKVVNSGDPLKALKGKWALKYLKRALENEVEQLIGETTTIPEDSILSVAKAQATFDTEWHESVQDQVRRTLTVHQTPTAVSAASAS
jgi:hypothetical protein